VAALRALILVVLFVITAIPVRGQDALGEPTSIDPVAAAMSADHQTKCDEVGWGVLPEHFDGGTLIAPFQHYGICHQGVGAIFFGGCVEPFFHEDVPESVPPGKAEIGCTVSVTALEDFGTTVDPRDFFILDNQDRSYEAMPETFTVPRALKLTELHQNEAAGGHLFFTVDAPVNVPFSLVWWPAVPTDQRFAVIVVDQPIPYEDALGTGF
jgi:hypothetical protein